MWRYIIRRLLYSLPALLLTTIIVFGILHTTPGDVIVAKLADQATLSQESIDKLKREYGLDKPEYQQYLIWLRRIVTGDLGTSIYTSESIADTLKDRFPITLQLAIQSIIIGVALGVSVGVVSALYPDKPIDYTGRLVAIFGLAAPNFWIATVTLTALAILLGWIPPAGYRPFWEDPGTNLQQFMLPSVIIGFGLSASVMRMTRSTLLEVMREDYIRTAYAKGLAQRIIIVRHALKNAFLPVITIIGGQISGLLSGTVIIESIFALPGLGRTALDGITFRDYPLVQTIVLIFAIKVIVLNLVVDLSYAWLDPRVRYQ